MACASSTSSREAAAYTGRILSDLGADVVLVEPPTGSPAREVPANVRVPSGEAVSAHFLYMAAGKRSVTIDLTNASGQQLFRRLADATRRARHRRGRRRDGSTRARLRRTPRAQSRVGLHVAHAVRAHRPAPALARLRPRGMGVEWCDARDRRPRSRAARTWWRARVHDGCAERGDGRDGCADGAAQRRRRGSSSTCRCRKRSSA